MKMTIYISILMQAMISSYLQTYLHMFMYAAEYSRNILSVLCTFIQTTETSALICLGDQSGSSAVTVLSQDSSMYIFDSHSRDFSGMPSANGTAVLIQFDDIQSTVSFICELADSLAARLFH